MQIGRAQVLNEYISKVWLTALLLKRSEAKGAAISRMFFCFFSIIPENLL